MIPHTNFNNKGHLLYLHGSWLHFCICLYLAFHIEILMFSVAMGCPKKIVILSSFIMSNFGQIKRFAPFSGEPLACL